MRAAARNPQRAARPNCLSSRKLRIPAYVCSQKASLRRCVCHASGDGDESSAEDGDPTTPQEPPPSQDESETEEIREQVLTTDGDSPAIELQRRAQYVREYFQSSYDPMYNGKWVDIQGAEMKMPDYDFSEYDWMARVPSDIGWPMFWECAFTH